jgi:hypothetical protein
MVNISSSIVDIHARANGSILIIFFFNSLVYILFYDMCSYALYSKDKFYQLFLNYLIKFFIKYMIHEVLSYNALLSFNIYDIYIYISIYIKGLFNS